MLAAVIVGCEIGFWLILAVGLALRYLLHRPRAGVVVLVLAPVVDLVLLVVTVLDLRAGASAEWMHGLAAAYIGFSIAFGHSTIRWADARFAQYFAGGPGPDQSDRYGSARAIKEWRLFGLAAVAWLVSCALLLAAIALVGDGDTSQLQGWIGRLSVVLGIWFIVALTYTVFPKRAPA
jgi:disulfide bond formation protein DsbB